MTSHSSLATFKTSTKSNWTRYSMKIKLVLQCNENLARLGAFAKSITGTHKVVWSNSRLKYILGIHTYKHAYSYTSVQFNPTFKQPSVMVQARIYLHLQISFLIWTYMYLRTKKGSCLCTIFNVSRSHIFEDTINITKDYGLIVMIFSNVNTIWNV